VETGAEASRAPGVPREVGKENRRKKGKMDRISQAKTGKNRQVGHYKFPLGRTEARKVTERKGKGRRMIIAG